MQLPLAVRPYTGFDVEHRLDLQRLPAPVRPAAMLRVLDSTEWFGDTSGGIRTYLLEKARYVCAREMYGQVMVVPGAMHTWSDSTGVRMYRVAGPPIPGQAPYRLLLNARLVSRIVEHERPHIIEAGSPFIVPWLLRSVARREKVPLVTFYHANVPRLIKGGVTRAAAWRYMRLLHRNFAATIVSSKHSGQDLQREGISHLHHVPLGVDLELFHPRHRERRDAVRQRYGVPDVPLAGFIGRFAREKELDVLLTAWRIVEKRTDAHLLLVGAGPLDSSLRSQAAGLRVTFVPFMTDRTAVAELLASLDVYVAPARAETFGLSSLEALASGTSVLCANEGGVSEQVTASGAGSLFETGSSQSLADEFLKLLSRNLYDSGLLGRSFAERHHSWDVVFDRLFDVYRHVIAEYHAR